MQRLRRASRSSAFSARAVAALAAHVEGAGDLFIAARDAAAHLHVATATDAGFAADPGLGTGTVGQVLDHAAAGILAVDARAGCGLGCVAWATSHWRLY